MFFKFLTRVIWYIFCLIVITVLAWSIISWIDVLAHNDPITGDKDYWKYNAIVLMVEKGKIR